MQFDVYQPCPGATGKKIKFCGCKEILPQLDKLFRTVEGGQRQAALDLALQIDSETPDRPCVLMQIVELQLETGQAEQAETTLERFLAAHPQNPVALAQQAVINLIRSDVLAAVEPLQRSIEFSGSEMPLAVFETIGHLGQAFLRVGNLPAGRAHLLIQAALAPQDDNRAAQVLERLGQMQGVPLLLKQDLLVEPCPAGVPWGSEYNEALQLETRMLWDRALEQFRELAERHPLEPTLCRSVAVLLGRLGDLEGSVEAWRKFASLAGVPLEEAVEAEALAQVLDKHSYGSQVDVVKLTYQVEDLPALSERLLSDKSIETMRVDPSQLAGEDQPPPKAALWLLDKPMPASGAGLAEKDVPCALGECLLFGRQTDQAARLEMTLVRNSRFEEARAQLTAVAGDCLSGEPQEAVVGREPRVPTELTFMWRLPPDTLPEDREEFFRSQQQRVMLERWPELPLDVLEGNSPRQVAGDPAYRVRLLAAILLLELSQEQTSLEFDYDELRTALGLSAREPISPSEEGFVRLPVGRLSRLNIEELSDLQLAQVMREAMYCGDRRTALRVGRQLLSRPQLDAKLEKASLCGLISQVTGDSSEALELAQQAQQLQRSASRSPAQYLLVELAVRIRRGEIADTQRLLRMIQANHMQEPGIGEGLMRILTEAGVIGPDGRPAGPPPGGDESPAALPADEESAASAAGLWTPEAGSSAGAAEDRSTGGSKLWVPGMD